MTDPAKIAEGLTEAQRADIVKIGDPRNPFGGLFDALSANDLITFKLLGIVRCYIPKGCYAPITKLTPRGTALRAHLQREKPNG